jgi:hypothetical protein
VLFFFTLQLVSKTFLSRPDAREKPKPKNKMQNNFLKRQKNTNLAYKNGNWAHCEQLQFQPVLEFLIYCRTSSRAFGELLNELFEFGSVQ